MARSILSVVAGFLAWTVLWLSGNAGIRAALPDSFREDLTTDRDGVLLLIVAMSVVISLLAGLVTALIARGPGRTTWVLGVLLLAVGILVQSQSWNLLPVWYHLSFLALLIPAVLLGARLRSIGGAVPSPA